MIKQNHKHEHMFRICFVWVYIIKGFCPLIRGKQTLVCEGFAVRGERFCPLLKLASIGRLYKCTFSYACRIVSYVCPKSFYIKGNKTAYLGFYCRTIFYDNVPSFRFLLSERLGEADQLFK